MREILYYHPLQIEEQNEKILEVESKSMVGNFMPRPYLHIPITHPIPMYWYGCKHGFAPAGFGDASVDFVRLSCCRFSFKIANEMIETS